MVLKSFLLCEMFIDSRDTNLIIHIAGGHFGEPRGRGAFALSLHKRVKPLVIFVKPDFYSNLNANTYSRLCSTKKNDPCWSKKPMLCTYLLQMFYYSTLHLYICSMSSQPFFTASFKLSIYMQNFFIISTSF